MALTTARDPESYGVRAGRLMDSYSEVARFAEVRFDGWCRIDVLEG